MAESTLDHARALLAPWLTPEGALRGAAAGDDTRWIEWRPGDEDVTLEGEFSAAELLAVALLISGGKK